jgi:hypothetical protein
MQFKRFRITIAALVVVGAATGIAAKSAPGSEVFHYKLIEGRNNVQFSDTGVHWIAGLTGSLRFEVGGDGSVTMQDFDVRFDGTFQNVSGNADAPFEPGDLLTDLLRVDFATSDGILRPPPPLEIEPPLPFDPDSPVPSKIYVGPDVRSESPHSAFLGHDYFKLGHLGRAEGYFTLRVRGNDAFGGDFRMYPPGSGPDPGPDGIVPDILIFTPNVRLVPEPASIVLVLLAAGVVLCWRRCN